MLSEVIHPVDPIHPQNTLNKPYPPIDLSLIIMLGFSAVGVVEHLLHHPRSVTGLLDTGVRAFRLTLKPLGQYPQSLELAPVEL